MVRASHGRCRICKALIHKRNPYGLCNTHMTQHQRKLKTERQATKARRRARQAQAQQNGVPTMPLDPKPDLPAKEPLGPFPIPRWSDDQKLEIAGHYANHDIPTTAIVQHYHLANGEFMQIVDDLGVPRRGMGGHGGRPKPPGHFEGSVWIKDAVLDGKPDVPPETARALENMLRLPATPEPVARPAKHTSTLVEWDVTVQGKLRLPGEDIGRVYAMIQRMYPDLRITSIAQAGE